MTGASDAHTAGVQPVGDERRPAAPAAEPRAERVADGLNHALHTVLAAGADRYLIGEDVLDPYGGAFKITRGLSTRFPGQVIGTPLSENAIVGVGGGLALAGNVAIVEVMFGDFLALGFDQLVNFAAKSVTMYGRRIPLRLVVRCPVGGNRNYGPTHSQHPLKHILGVPNLGLYELSAFHDSGEILRAVLATSEPAVLFEDKVLYTRRRYRDGVVNDLFRYELIGEAPGTARIRLADGSAADCVIVATGGVAGLALAASRTLLLEHDIACEVLVPARLYPFDLAPLVEPLRRARHLVVVEESVAGGTWGDEVAARVHQRMWNLLRGPVVGVHSDASIIPTAGHLERRVLVQEADVVRAVEEVVGA